MAPTPRARRVGLGADRVRDHLLTSLHLGKLAPGDRVTSVRRLADLTGLNRKTIHRAYRELAREGLLLSRPGSGTFVAARSVPEARGAGAADLLGVVERCRRDAATHGMTPRAFAAFVDRCLGDGLRGLPVAVVECNLEQIGLIAADLRSEMGVAPRGVPLASILSRPATTVGAAAVVTTDCHYAEVAAAVSPTEVPVFRVALDGEFPKRVLRRLGRAPLVLVVRDLSFERPFRRLLAQIGGVPESLARLFVATPASVRARLAEAGRGAAVCVSPLVSEETEGRIPASVPRLSARWTVPPEALERLRAELARSLDAPEASPLRSRRGA